MMWKARPDREMMAAVCCETGSRATGCEKSWLFYF